jgi:glutamate-1-semialdehyde 2,1-aminomutase
MSSQESEKIKQDILQRYIERTPKSKACHETARKFLPGGDTRAIAFFPPYPFFADRGQGCNLYDCDGNEYLDYVNNMTAMIHGHAHPHIVKALQAQLEKGTTPGAPVEAQAELAELLCKRIPSFESLRFTNTGSEATLFSMRIARAFTGRDIIVKIDGGYHGNHDFVQINPYPDMTTADEPQPQPSRGVPACTMEGIRITPFNDLDHTEKLFRKNKGKIAAVIMEPILGQSGAVNPKEGYLQGMRELTDHHGSLLIFDEIVTFRLHEQGIPGLYGVIPDITAVGKIVSGGLPIGVFGARNEIMKQFELTHPNPVIHSGTFSGNPLSMVAGLASLEIFKQKEIDQLNALGDRLRDGLQAAMSEVGVRGQVRGLGSMLAVFFSEGPWDNARDFSEGLLTSGEFLRFLHLEMLNRGIFFLHRGMFTLSTPMTESEVDQAIVIFKESLEKLRPLADEIGLT